MRYVTTALVVTILVIFSACNSSTPYEEGAPAGWEESDGRWWSSGVDTTVAFRNMETIESMGVDQTDIDRARVSFARSVKQALIRLYRNQPEVVDSLFHVHVVPDMAEAQFSSNVMSDVDRFKEDGYRAIGRSFQEPRTRLALGEDITVVYPDSLREAGIGGRVSMQVYLNEEGEPLAIELLEGVHPVLDDLAMTATSEMRWRPAYLLQQGDWSAIPSWARFNINYATGQ